MALLELRPIFCVDDSAVRDVLDLGQWRTMGKTPISEMDGDTWRPGEGLHLVRDVTVKAGTSEIRSQLSWQPGVEIGIGARWICRTTGLAGTHTDGPLPVPIDEVESLAVEVPADVGGEVEVETCLIVRHVGTSRPDSAPPNGAMLWSDAWSIPRRDRSVLLEGSETRIPVAVRSFSKHYESGHHALWTVDVVPGIDLETPLANALTIVLNSDALDRDFAAKSENKDEAGQGDPALLHEFALTGISVDLISVAVAALRSELNGSETWDNTLEGSVGSIVVLRLLEAFGSVEAALNTFDEDRSAFKRIVWSTNSPGSWSDNRPAVSA